MSRSTRLLSLLQQLRVLPAPVTCDRLAESLEVSKRTIYRDIQSLRASGARIDGSAGFGYRLEEDPMLPPLQFTENEIEALVLGLREVGEIGDPALAESARQAMAKLIAGLPERLRGFAAHAVLTAKSLRVRPAPGVDPTSLRRAAWDERELLIHYRDKDGVETRRKVLPLSIVYLDESDLLVAWCSLRQGYRHFRLDRIAKAEETGVSFRPRRTALLREFFEQTESAGVANCVS